MTENSGWAAPGPDTSGMPVPPGPLLPGPAPTGPAQAGPGQPIAAPGTLPAVATLPSAPQQQYRSSAPVRGWYDDPQHTVIGRLRFWDGTRWTYRTQMAVDPLHPQRPTFGSRGLAASIQVFLGIAILVAALLIPTLLSGIDLMGRWASEPDPGQAARDFDAVHDPLRVLAVLITLTLAALWISWQMALTRSERMDPSTFGASPALLGWSWAIPAFQFWGPLEAVLRIWQNVGPHRARSLAGTTRPAWAEDALGADRKVRVLAVSWWVFFLVAIGFHLVGSFMGSSSPRVLAAAYWCELIGAACAIVAAVLAFLTVRSITRYAAQDDGLT